MAWATGLPRLSWDPSSMSSTSKEALCSREMMDLMASIFCCGILSHALKASIRAPRTSLPGVSPV